MSIFDWVIPVEGDLSRGIRSGFKFPTENITYDLSIVSEVEWDGIWPRKPSIGFDYRRGQTYSDIKCFCQSERGRLMKRREDCRGEYQICDHRQYGNQTGCGLRVEKVEA